MKNQHLTKLLNFAKRKCSSDTNDRSCFYTRIECYNSDKKKVGAIHIGVLHRLPKDLAKILYPGGIVEYTL